MKQVAAYAAQSKESPLAPFTVERREPRPEDVALEILYCGICHSDLHQSRDEWNGALFPMVPGHEIVGRVTQVGSRVSKFKVGDLAGVGCFVDSCRVCEFCKRGLENFCVRGPAYTYNSTEMDRKTPTFGGYSTAMVVAEPYLLRIAPTANPAKTAPLLCAGITTYSPLRQWDVKRGSRVAVVGLGGLGHMAVKLAAKMGAEVTVLSTSAAKERDAARLGARAFEVTRSPGVFQKLGSHFDLIVDTVSAPHDYAPYLEMLRPYGVMVLLGVPPERTAVSAMTLIAGNRRLAGSNIGGIAETQEMLDYCAKQEIGADVEVIRMEQVNEAYERMARGDVRYRFVIDINSLRAR
jgi:uncharacterized zinc-type alcohol dehydrogenase-like protein